MKQKNKQSGAALAIGMMLLLIVSMIGITSMKSAMLQERMAGGLKNRENADAAALAIMVAAERYLHTYYLIGNATELTPGIGPVVNARTDDVRLFKSERNLDGGFAHPEGVSLVDEFDGSLAAEPRFLIESVSDMVTQTISGGSFTNTGAEDLGDGNGIKLGSGQVDIRVYRVISKATDSTGNLYTGYESVVSVPTGN